MTEVAARTITIDAFIESMQAWISRTISRTVRPGHALFSREDLMQESQCELLKVWAQYAERVPEADLRKISTTAVRFHVGNLYYSAKSLKRGGGVPLVSLDWVDFSGVDRGGRSNHDVDHLRSVFKPRHDDALDRLLVREAVEHIAAESDETHRALRAALADTRPASSLPSAEAMKIFRQVKKKVQHTLLRDGYMGGSAVSQTKQGGHAMFESKGPEGPTSPDAPIAPVAPGAAAPPARARSKKTAPDRGSSVKRQSADETAKASSTFKKGQKVTYLGDGRASWLKAGTTLEVKGTVVSRGRTYVRCYATNAKRKVSLSSALLSAANGKKK